MASLIDPNSILIDPQISLFAADVREQLTNAKADIETLQSDMPDIGTWRFGDNFVTSDGSTAPEGQFFYRSTTTGAILRVQGIDPGVGEAVGFLASCYSATSPAVLVMHRDNGTREDPEALTLNDYLGILSFKGTINGAGNQGVGAYIRAITTEDTSSTGTLGTDMLIECTPLGSILPSATKTLRVSHDTGIVYKGTTIVDGNSNLIGASPSINYVDNPSLDLWEAGITFALASATDTHTADRWLGRRAAANSTHSRQTGFSGATYAYRMQRDAGDSSTSGMQVFHHVPTKHVRAMAGKSYTFALDTKVGADYSGGAWAITWYSGTAGGETLSTTGTLGFATGGVASSNVNLGTPTTSASRLISAAYTIPSDAKDLAVRLFWTPSGTAGAADYGDFTNVRIGEGSITAYAFPDLRETIEECARYYQKSFASATAPAQNVGADTGEYRFPATVAGANTNRLGTIPFITKMASVPTITLYNPAASSAHVRDLTAAANCTSSAAANITTNGFALTCVANAGTAVGNDLAVHWVADSRFI